MTESRRLVSICIVTRNRADRLGRAVESALAQTHAPVEIVVVDNGSSDRTRHRIGERFPEVTLVPLDRNAGIPGGRNRAMERARGAYVVFLDDDAVLDPRAVERAVELAESRADAGIVMLRIVEEGTVRWKGRARGSELAEFVGAAYLVRRDAAERIGPYHEDLAGLRQAEEFEYSLRILEAGLKILYCPSAVAHHYPEPNRSVDLARLSFVNSTLTLLRHAPIADLSWELPRALLGYGRFLLARGAVGAYVRAVGTIARNAPRTWRGRSVLARGWRRYRRLRGSGGTA